MISFETIPSWLCISLWLGCGYSMIVYNKVILSSWKFGFPFFLTAWHCLFATILTQLLSRLFPNMFPSLKAGKVTAQIFIKKFLPISFCFACGLVLGNSAYRYLSLAYIQMLKSMTPVPMLLMAFIAGKENPSIFQLGLVFLICFGVTMSTVGELHFKLVGFALQVGAVLCDVTRMTILDLVLSDLKLDSLSTLYYLAPPSTVFIGMGFFFFEYYRLDADAFYPAFTLAIFFSGCLAFCLNVSVVLVVGSVSAMTVSIFGLLKDIAVVLSSSLIFQSPITPLQIFGYSVSLAGMSTYRDYKKDPNIAVRRMQLLPSKLFALLTQRLTLKMFIQYWTSYDLNAIDGKFSDDEKEATDILLTDLEKSNAP